MAGVEKQTITRPKRVVATGGGEEEPNNPLERSLPPKNIITKLYLCNDGDNIESILNELGGQLYSEKKYRLTLMLEEVEE